MSSESSRCCASALAPLEVADAERYAADFALLGDPTRLRMLSLISAGHCDPVCVGDLVEPLGVSQPTVSHHLSKLTAAGLLRREQVGRTAYFTIVPEYFALLRSVIGFG